MRIKKIFIVPYCHADWAWTFHRRWHEKRYVLVFKEVLALCRRWPDFRWYFDTYLTQLEPFLRSCPELLPELRKRISHGQINICGTYTNLRPTMTGEETQIRDILIGQKMYRQIFPEADLSVCASPIDVSLGHPQMPQLLTLGGYRYFRFWRPHAALSAKKVPLEFYWQGLDGSLILCSRGSYSGLNYHQNFEKGFQKELAYDADLSPTGLRWLSQGMDDGRPLRSSYEDRPVPLLALMRRWNRSRKPPLCLATPLEFFRVMEKEKDNLPVISGSLDPCDVAYNVGWGGQHGLFRYRGENERLLTETELCCALASLFGEPYPAEALERFWQEHLLSCAHATQWLFTPDFEEIKNRAVRVNLSVRELKRKTLKKITSQFSFPGDAEAVVFNPLPFRRETNLSLVISFPEKNRKLVLTDETGRQLPIQITERNRDQKTVWEYLITTRVKLPASGFTFLRLSPRKKPCPEKVSPALKILWENQEITSVVAGERKYRCPEGSGFGVLRLYRIDTTRGILHVGPVTGMETVTWEKTWPPQDGPLFTLWESQGRIGPHRLLRRVFLHKKEPRLEFQVVLDWQEEDGFLTIEWPRLNQGQIFADVPFGVEEKRIEEEPFQLSTARVWDAIERQRKNLFYARSFLLQQSRDIGFGYINHDATRYYLLGEATVAHILHNSVTRLSGWEKFVNDSIKGRGQHRFVS
ncbi:MAG TPA: hypothetical protein PKW42_06800, partial [bacterium]|nr:hypothetical protein [bacterium]